jgi:hypothetical protein
MARNRIIYQSKALYISPNATGVQAVADGVADVTAAKAKTDTNATELSAGTGLLYKLDRVQNCNFSFTINRQDINELGKLARVASISNEPPTVSLDYSYYITDGLNERLMGFNFGGSETGEAGAPSWDTNMVSGANAISGFLTETQGQNYYIVTVDEGEDVVGATLGSTTDSIIAIGNGYLTNYEFTASVGEIPTANITIEGFNIKSDVGEVSSAGFSGVSPAIRTDATPATTFGSTDYYRFYKIGSALVSATAGTGATPISALRPGDIVLSMPNASAENEDSFVKVDGTTDSVRIQSFSFSVPLARTTLSRLGTFFGYAKVIDVPLNMDVTINAFVNELVDKNLFNVLCGDQPKKEFTVTLNQCADVGGSPTPAIAYNFRGAILSSESHSVDIGGNETVDLTYSIQIGGANDTANGLFMSGSYNTGINSALEAAYPFGGAGASGFGVLVNDFYKIGTARNY